MTILFSLVVFLLILSVLVLIHEAGHYFVAKWLGIKVEEFGFGFPLTRSLISVKRGETVYSFYPLLIGGFVKLYGEDEAGAGRIGAAHKDLPKKDLTRAFFSRPLWQRTAVIVAGVFMNALLAVFVYYLFLSFSSFKTELPLIGDHKFFLVNQQVNTAVIISEVVKNSPAENAKIKPFSRITAVNGQKINNTDDFVKIVNTQKGREITIDLEDTQTQKKYTASLTPRVNPPKGEGALGVAFFPVRTAVLSYDTPTQKALSGFTHPANLMAYNFDILGTLIGLSVKEKTVDPLKPAVSGPVGIGFVVGSIVSIEDLKARLMQLLNLTGLLSVSLAVMNILPIPGLDGGRLFFIIIEAVTRRKVNPKVEGYIHAVGMALLLLLIFLVTFNDIQMRQNDIINFFQNLFR